MLYRLLALCAYTAAVSCSMAPSNSWALSALARMQRVPGFASLLTGSQKRSLHERHLTETYTILKEEHQDKSPPMGAAMGAAITRLYHCPTGDPLSTVVSNLFHVVGRPDEPFSDTIPRPAQPTLHLSCPGASFTPTIIAKLVSWGDKQTDTLRKEIVVDLKQSHQQKLIQHGGQSGELKTGRINGLLDSFMQAVRDTKYPGYYPYAVLTNLLWQRATHKQQLVEYMQELHRQLGACVPAPGRLEPDFQALAARSMTDEELRDAAENSPLNIRPLITDAQAFEQEAIVRLLNSNTPLPRLVLRAHYGFKGMPEVADCAESTVRNFINCLLLRNGTFDLSLLPTTAQPLPELLAFYNQYPTTASANDRQAGQAWMDFCSNHDGLTYMHHSPQGNYELEANAQTFFDVCAKLLGLPKIKSSTQLADILSTPKRRISVADTGDFNRTVQFIIPTEQMPITTTITIDHNRCIQSRVQSPYTGLTNDFATNDRREQLHTIALCPNHVYPKSTSKEQMLYSQRALALYALHIASSGIQPKEIFATPKSGMLDPNIFARHTQLNYSISPLGAHKNLSLFCRDSELHSPTYQEYIAYLIRINKAAGQLNGINPETGTTLLNEAVLSQNKRLVEDLLAAGADPHVRDQRVGKTAFDYAQHRSDEIKKDLEKYR